MANKMAATMMPLQHLLPYAFRSLMLFVASGLLLLALAEPRWCGGTKPVLRHGADVLFILDVSRSMQATDVAPNRLMRAKQEIAAISQNVQGGRRGLLIFAASPLLHCPLTTDRDGFATLLNMAAPELIEEQGTRLQPAFALASTIFDVANESNAASTRGVQVIVLLSDGEDHDSNVQRAAQQLAKQSVQLFVIGVGSLKPSPIPLADGSFKRDASGQVVMSRFRPQMLQAFARQAKGLYRHSHAEVWASADVVNRINRYAADSRIVMEPATNDSSLLRLMVGIAVALLFMETLLRKSS